MRKSKKPKLEIYSNEYINLMEQPLFFGEGRNTQRYDRNKFEFLSNLSLKMQRLFWVIEEVKLQKDKLDFENLTVAEDWVFTEQLQKLVMLDSYQGRNPLLTFGQLTTNPEFEAVLTEQEYFEARIHSRSYSYMIENIYPDANRVFRDSWKNKTLMKHAETTVKEGNKLYDEVIKYIYKEKFEDGVSEEEFYNLRKQILLAMVSMNVLEGIRFYLGFASIWAITEFTGKMPGSSRILAFIQRDERQHLAFTQYTINQLKKHPMFKDIWKEIESEVYEMYFQVSEEEFEWADHLYSKGSIMGMNAELGKNYIKYLTNQRLLAIGLKPIYPEIKTNPLKWVNKYINLHNTETSLQESEAVDYLSDPINEDEEIDYNELWNHKF